MGLFLELFLTAFVALVCSFIIAKLVSVAVPSSGEEKILDEKTVVEEVKLDKGFKVERAKSKKKRVKFVDDVVVRIIDHFEGSEEPITDFQLCENISEKVGILEGVVVGEGMKTEGFGDENELILINDGSDQNDAAAVERLAANAEVLDEVLEREAVEERSEDTAIHAGKVYESSTQMLSGGLENLVVGEKVHSEVELASDDIAIPQNEEGRAVTVKEDAAIGTIEEFSKENEGGKGILRDENVDDYAAAADDDDDDWEGIERNELEKVFAEAVNYVEFGGKSKDEQLASLGSDMQMQLYGLHKLALEGACHEPQPMALKVSARAKWNAWQKLGSMNPEVAMEEYIKILSDKDPGWMQHSSAEDYKHGSLGTGVYGSPDTKSSSLQDPQANVNVGTTKNEKVD